MYIHQELVVNWRRKEREVEVQKWRVKKAESETMDGK